MPYTLNDQQISAIEDLIDSACLLLDTTDAYDEPGAIDISTAIGAELNDLDTHLEVVIEALSDPEYTKAMHTATGEPDDY